MSYDEICKVIGAGRNDDGKPIAKTTLIRNFKNELANGRAMLKARVMGKFYQALDNGEPWAVQIGLRNQFGWDNGRNGLSVTIPAEDSEGTRNITIEFVLPGAKSVDLDSLPSPQRAHHVHHVHQPIQHGPQPIQQPVHHGPQISPQRIMPSPDDVVIERADRQPSAFAKRRGSYGWME
jgi:hypothetical protein